MEGRPASGLGSPEVVKRQREEGEWEKARPMIVTSVAARERTLMEGSANSASDTS